MAKKSTKTTTGIELGAPPPEAKPTEEEGTRAVGVRLPAALADSIDAICQDKGVSRSALVRFILSRFVADYQVGKIEIPTRTVTIADI